MIGPVTYKPTTSTRYHAKVLSMFMDPGYNEMFQSFVISGEFTIDVYQLMVNRFKYIDSYLPLVTPYRSLVIVFQDLGLIREEQYRSWLRLHLLLLYRSFYTYLEVKDFITRHELIISDDPSIGYWLRNSRFYTGSCYDLSMLIK